MLRELTILGSGTIVPHSGRSCAGYLLETDEELVLLDCGPGTLLRLSQLEKDLAGISRCFLTHYHLDHVSDLFAVLLSRWMRGVPEEDRVFLTGPPGLKKIAEEMKKLFFSDDEWFGPERIRVKEIGENLFEEGNLSIRTLHTKHTEKSICYRIGDKAGKSLFYSGDTAWNENIAVLCDNSDLAIIECSHSSRSETADHMTPARILRLHDRVNVKKMVLTHLYPDFFEDPDIAEILERNIVIARDLDSFCFS